MNQPGHTLTSEDTQWSEEQDVFLKGSKQELTRVGVGEGKIADARFLEERRFGLFFVGFIVLIQ